MVRQDGVDYVKSCRNQGFSDDSIRIELKRSGWPDHEIDNVFLDAGRVELPMDTIVPPDRSSVTRPQPSVSGQTIQPHGTDVVAQKSPETEVRRPSFAAMSGAPLRTQGEVPVAYPPSVDIKVEMKKPDQEKSLDMDKAAERSVAPAAPSRAAMPSMDAPMIYPKKDPIVASAAAEQSLVPKEPKVPVVPEKKDIPVVPHSDLVIRPEELTSQSSLSKEKVSISTKIEPTPAVSLLQSTVKEKDPDKESLPSQPRPSQGPAPMMRPSSFFEDNVVVDLAKNSGPQSPGGAMVAAQFRQKISHKKLWFGVAAGLLMTTAALASGGYIYYSKILYPKKLLSEGIAGLAGIKSYHYETEFQMRIKDTPARVGKVAEPLMPQGASLLLSLMAPQLALADEPASVEVPTEFMLKLRVKGDSDIRDEKNPKALTIFTVDTREMLGRNFEMESRVLDGKYYIQLVELPRIPSEYASTVPFADTALFERKWVVVDPIKLDEAMTRYQKDLVALDPSAADLNTLIAPSGPPHVMSPAEVVRLQTLWDNFQTVSWDQTPHADTVRGEQAYRFRGTLDKTKLKGFLAEVFNTSGRKLSSDEEMMFGDFVDMLENPEVNIWVASSNKQIVKITFGTSVASPKLSTKGGAVELLMTTHVSNINGALVITAPDEAQDVVEVLDSAIISIKESFVVAQAKSRDARRIADLRQIQLALELYVGERGAYPISLDALVPEFIPTGIPKDPSTGKSYSYKRSGSKTYHISARLETQKHPALTSDAVPGDQFYDVKQP